MYGTGLVISHLIFLFIDPTIYWAKDYTLQFKNLARVSGISTGYNINHTLLLSCSPIDILFTFLQLQFCLWKDTIQ